MVLFRRALLAALATAVVLGAQQTDADFFEEQVQPVLATCLPCHNEQLKSSGLSLDTRDAILRGGIRGQAAKPGQPEDSLLIQAVRQSGDLKMPPKGQLPPEQLAALERWVKEGLPWKGAAAGQPLASKHWAFTAPVRSDPPQVKNAGWIRNPIDNFVLAQLEGKNIQPSPEADRYALLRRVSLDITGLPPSAEEVEEFLADNSPQAYEKVVDRLLASPHYGERWGRYWLDLARYADSDGYSIDAPRPIWKYRDWVIAALNRDQPFDQFVIEQMAGDLLPNPTTDQLIATGFHRNTPSNFEGGIDFEQYRVEAVADRVATTSGVFLGLTIGCARCHDHKYDPIRQKEFYELFAFLNSADEITKESERHEFYRPVLFLPTPKEVAAADAYRSQVRALSHELIDYCETLQARPRQADDPPLHEDAGLLARVGTLRELMRPGGIPNSPEYRWRQPEARMTRTLIMRELPQPRETFVHLGGDFLKHGDRVSPGVPAVLSSKPVTGNRLDLARWLVSPDNPLTARVTVNRIWQSYFGKGLVETEGDFGLMGSPPTHPKLLDWLATEFIRRGWSQKQMHRLIATSATYRQSSRHRPDLEETDPYNRLLARQARIRLDAEIIRDNALVASGLLAAKIGGPGVYPPIPDGTMTTTQVKRPWPTDVGPDRYRRGLYTFFYRMSPPPSLVLFDAPNGQESCTRRVRSTSPLQALTLLNDQAFLEFAVALAKRILTEAPAHDRDRLEHAFLLALGRKPSPNDLDRLTTLLTQQREEYNARPAAALEVASALDAGMGRQADGETQPSVVLKDAPELAAWTAVSRVLLNLDSFMTRE